MENPKNNISGRSVEETRLWVGGRGLRGTSRSGAKGTANTPEDQGSANDLLKENFLSHQ